LGTAIGDILPFALGIGFFPIPIITMILVLFSPNARANGLGFMAGWILGVAALPTIFTLATEGVGADRDPATYILVSWIKVLLGVGLLVLAYRQWRARPAPGQEPEMPGWMRRIDSLTPGGAVGTGLLLSAGSPKNIVLGAGAGTSIGQLGLPPGEIAVVVLVFTAVASVTTGGPVLYYLLNGERAMAVLKTIRVWLTQNLAAVMTVMLLILGAVLIGNGIHGLSGPP
jgi:hypothetical protein